MQESSFSAPQIIAALQERTAGVPIVDLPRQRLPITKDEPVTLSWWQVSLAQSTS
jgi:hypothetical protein